MTGAHWRRKNLPEVLALRLSICNGEWHSDWIDSTAILAPAKHREADAA